MVQVVLVAQSYLTLCHPKNCSLPGSSVHGILQARILKWIAIPFSRRVQNDTLFLLSKASSMCTCQDSTLSHESTPSHSSWNEFLEILLLFQLSMAGTQMGEKYRTCSASCANLLILCENLKRGGGTGREYKLQRYSQFDVFI